MERPAGWNEARLDGPSTKLDELIEAKMRREYAMAVKRINKRKWRVPQLLAQLATSKLSSKERKKLEDELTLLMRKARIDNELVRKFASIYGTADDNDDDSSSRGGADSNRKRRKKTSENLAASETNEELDSSSVNSFQQAGQQAPSGGRYSKNRQAGKQDTSYKYKKTATSPISKTFESGYSSLDEYISGEPRRAESRNREAAAVAAGIVGGSEPDLPMLVKQAERERVTRVEPVRVDEMRKMSELGVEAPRVVPMQEIRVAAQGGLTRDDDDDYDYSNNQGLPR